MSEKGQLSTLLSRLTAPLRARLVRVLALYFFELERRSDEVGGMRGEGS